MTANIKSLVFYVIMTPFPFYKNMLKKFQADLVLIEIGPYWPNFSLVFLIHLFLYAGVYCIGLPSDDLACYPEESTNTPSHLMLKKLESRAEGHESVH